jgi:hypothetical protein
MCLLWVLCVVRKRSLRRADHSSRAVLRLWCGNSPLTPTMTRQTKVRIRNHLSVQFFRCFLTSAQQSESLCEVLLVMSAAPTFPISLASHDAVRRRRLETVTDSHKQLSTAVTSIGSRAGTRVRAVVLITAALFWRKRRKFEHERQGLASERKLHSTIFPVLNLRERDNLEDLGVAQKIILKCIFNK